MGRHGLATVASVLVIGLAGCTGDDAGGQDSPASAQPSGSERTRAETWETASDARAELAEMTWRRRPGDRWRTLPETVLSRGWRADADQDAQEVRFEGPSAEFVHDSPRGFAPNGLHMQWPWAVVQDSQRREGSKRDHLVVHDLRDRSASVLGRARGAAVPTSLGASALWEDALVYTSGDPSPRSKNFCVSLTQLGNRGSRSIACARPRQGFTNLTISEYGVGYASFGDQRPASCMTLTVVRSNGERSTVDAARKCLGAFAVPWRDGWTFWMDTPSANEIDVVQAFVQSPDGEVTRLGTGDNFSAVPCGDHIYFVRESRTFSDLARWSPEDGLQIVLRPDAKRGAIVDPPTCGGDHLTTRVWASPRNHELVTTRID